MNEEIKVSELDVVDEVRDTDVIMEISGGANKKATIQQVKDNIVKDEYGTADNSSYAQSYQNEHNVIVSPTEPTTSERVWFKKGKNLFSSSLELGTYSDIGIKSGSSTNYRNVTPIAVQPNTTYTFSINGVSQKYVIYYYNNTNTFINSEGLTTGTFTTPANCYYINFRCFNADFTSDYANLKLQIEKGDTATSYEPYVTPSIIVDNTEFYSQEYINGKTLGTSLYSNASGTHEAFTLSEDIKHFREIEVTFGRSSWTNMKQKVRVVPQQSGTTPIGLIALYPTTDGNSLVLASAVFEIGSGGTNATFPRNTSGTIGSTGFVKDTATYVNVYEVVGYK